MSAEKQTATAEPVVFPIARVNRLRKEAERARDTSMHNDAEAGRIFNATAYAQRLLDVFETLALKPEFALCAYAFRGDFGGNGRVWAVPVDSGHDAERDIASMRDNEWMRRPPGAVPLMQAIVGDGTPWSYLSASILAREATEFGALLHDRDWSLHTIFATPPWESADAGDAPGSDTQAAKDDSPTGEWSLHAPAPDLWEPVFVEDGAIRRVTLCIHSPYWRETLYRVTDSFEGDSYEGRTEGEILSSGPDGLIFR